LTNIKIIFSKRIPALFAYETLILSVDIGDILDLDILEELYLFYN